jgi:predicted RNase H-like nuclease
MDAYIGFDSAWTDNPKAPGAICAVCFENGRPAQFHAPKLVSFAQAHTFIRAVSADDGYALLALDQPTIVPNSTGMRPVERAAASLISWLGGGVQPSNSGRLGMFCSASPIWRFLRELGTVENPEEARLAKHGLYLTEVFPALALASLSDEFFGRLSGPRYNPGRKKTFRANDWTRVAEAAAQEANNYSCDELANWCRDCAKIESPAKADQDKLDSALCVLIALRWRFGARSHSLLLGDLCKGYMILPASAPVREYLANAARKYSVPVDGVIPGGA